MASCGGLLDYDCYCSCGADIDLVVTGEWCHEVLAEYTQLHSGRGLQYYLGFHHADDSCPGWPAIGISQYLSDSLSSKVLGGLFLSTPMNNIIRHAFELLLSVGDTVAGGDSARAVSVKKVQRQAPYHARLSIYLSIYMPVRFCCRRTSYWWTRTSSATTRPLQLSPSLSPAASRFSMRGVSRLPTCLWYCRERRSCWTSLFLVSRD